MLAVPLSGLASRSPVLKNFLSDATQGTMPVALCRSEPYTIQYKNRCAKFKWPQPDSRRSSASCSRSHALQGQAAGRSRPGVSLALRRRRCEAGTATSQTGSGSLRENLNGSPISQDQCSSCPPLLLKKCAFAAGRPVAEEIRHAARVQTEGMKLSTPRSISFTAYSKPSRCACAAVAHC